MQAIVAGEQLAGRLYGSAQIRARSCKRSSGQEQMAQQSRAAVCLCLCVRNNERAYSTTSEAGARTVARRTAVFGAGQRAWVGAQRRFVCSVLCEVPDVNRVLAFEK